MGHSAYREKDGSISVDVYGSNDSECFNDKYYEHNHPYSGYYYSDYTVYIHKMIHNPHSRGDKIFQSWNMSDYNMEIERVNIYAGDGDDLIDINDRNSVYAYGGRGNDILIGTHKGDYQNGGSGNDVIIVGNRSGNSIDTVVTGQGADLIFGGSMSAQAAQQTSSLFGFKVDKDAYSYTAVSARIANNVFDVFLGTANPGLSVAFNTVRAIAELIKSVDAKPVNDLNRSDYVKVLDFNSVEDVYVYTGLSDDSDYVAEDYDNGKLEIYADTTSGNTGGIMAVLELDNDLIEYLGKNSSVSDVTIRQQLAEFDAKNAFNLSYLNGAYYSRGRELDLNDDSNSGIKGIVSSMQLENGQSVSVYGKMSSVLAQGSDITSIGSTGEVFLVGSRFGDVIYAGNVNDESTSNIEAHLFGFGGSDKIVGGLGDDHITGGKGNDYLMGSEGSDIFYFEKGDGFDTINDFNVHEDTIAIVQDGYSDMESGNFFASSREDIEIHNLAGYASIRYSEDSSVLLQNVYIQNADEIGFIFL